MTARVYQINTVVRDEFMRLTGLLSKRESASIQRDIRSVHKLDERILKTRKKIMNITRNSGLCL